MGCLEVVHDNEASVFPQALDEEDARCTDFVGKQNVSAAPSVRGIIQPGWQHHLSCTLYLDGSIIGWYATLLLQS